VKYDNTRPIFQDKTLLCIDCGQSFTFSASEARYFWERGLTQTKRCPACRQRRKLTLHRDFDSNLVPNLADYTTVVDLRDGK
jgi:hypothetical protein